MKFKAAFGDYRLCASGAHYYNFLRGWFAGRSCRRRELPGQRRAVGLLRLLNPVFTACVLAAAALSAACEQEEDEPLPQSRQFWCYNYADSSNYEVTANRLFVGTYCAVYQEENSAQPVGEEKAAEVAAEFDNNIYSKIKEAFGEPVDVDGNGLVILFLLDIQDGYGTSSGAYTAGYFWSRDLTDSKYSNRAEMLYIDTYPAKIGDESSYSTMAHEFQHLINFSVRTAGGKPQMDTWVNEGLSLAAEHIYRGGQLTDRLSYLGSGSNSNNNSYVYGNNFFIWDGYWENNDAPRGNKPNRAGENVLANYSTAYAFFQWLRIHADNGAEIYKDIIGSSYGDYRAVTLAAKTRIDSYFGTWEHLLRAWFVANYLQNKAGWYGYKGEITLPASQSPEVSDGYIELYPGEGVFSQITVTDTNIYQWGSDIRYARLLHGSAPEFGGGTYDSGCLLTFNSDSDNKSGGPQMGKIASAISRTRDALLSGIAGEAQEDVRIPEPWEWDGIAYIRRNTGN